MTGQRLTLDSLRAGAGCKVRRILDSFSPEDQQILNEALSGPEDEFPSGRIVSTLATLEIAITKDTIIKHRRGFCACNPARR